MPSGAEMNRGVCDVIAATGQGRVKSIDYGLRHSYRLTATRSSPWSPAPASSFLPAIRRGTLRADRCVRSLITPRDETRNEPTAATTTPPIDR